jgi:xanthine/uracil permease
MAGLLPADGQSPDSKTIIISLVTLGVTVFGSVLFRGFMAIIPILIGVLAGYALSFVMGVVDTTRSPGALVRAANLLHAALRMVCYFHHSACGAGGDCGARRPPGGDGEHR